MKTPQQPYPKLAEALGIKELYLKREDLHPYGSHKGRSIPLMMKEYIKQGIHHFVISSSGNAARAAATFVEKYYQNNAKAPIQLTIYIGSRIDPNKYQDLTQKAKQYPSITIIQTERPKQAAFLEEKKEGVVNLRQSTDDLALIGYKELGNEIAKLPNLSAVFIPTSSGTTALALAHTFQELDRDIQVHIVQTTVCHAIAKHFDPNYTTEETSLAGAIVDNVAHRKIAVIQTIEQTHGSGWVISNDEIQSAQTLVKQTTGLSISYTSALSVAGIKKAVQQGYSWEGVIVALITGP